jgi:hypothetical protein
LQLIPTSATGNEWDTTGWGSGLWLISTITAYLVLVAAIAFIPAIDKFLGYGSIVVFFQVGLWQWIYVLPLLIALRRRQKYQAAKGLLIFAAIVSGLDALCSGLLLGK